MMNSPVTGSVNANVNFNIDVNDFTSKGITLFSKKTTNIKQISPLFAIVFIGQTGAGKSSLLKQCMKHEGVKESKLKIINTTKSEESVTKVTSAYTSGTNLFVDTPGLLDTCRKDEDILSSMVLFLHKLNIPLIKFVHVINSQENRISNTSLVRFKYQVIVPINKIMDIKTKEAHSKRNDDDYLTIDLPVSFENKKEGKWFQNSERKFKLLYEKLLSDENLVSLESLTTAHSKYQTIADTLESINEYRNQNSANITQKFQEKETKQQILKTFKNLFDIEFSRIREAHKSRGRVNEGYLWCFSGCQQCSGNCVYSFRAPQGDYIPRATLDNLKDEMNSHQVDIDRIENEITSFLSNNDKIMQYHRESLTNLVESYSKFRLVKSLICHYQNCMGLCKLMGREKEFTLCQNRIQILEELKLQVPEEIRFLF